VRLNFFKNEESYNDKPIMYFVLNGKNIDFIKFKRRKMESYFSGLDFVIG